MKRGTIVALAVLSFLGLGGYASAQITPPPPPGQDLFESIAELNVDFTAPGFPLSHIDLDAVGPTLVDRGPADPTTGIIQTQILAMNLTGGGTAQGGPAADSFFDVFIDLDPNRPSKGQINSKTGDSFFDVFVRINVSQGGTSIGVFQNQEPVHLQAKINAVPPIETFYSPPPTAPPVHLIDSAGNPVGFLVHVQHVPAQPSHVKIKREILRIEKKLDRIILFLGA